MPEKVGVGYRLIDINDEVILGDEFLNASGGWTLCDSGIGYTPKYAYSSRTVRRRRSEPTEYYEP